MPEGDSFGPPFLDQSAKPLPWTKGGPNEDSNLPYPTVILVNSSVADPIFTIKNRVVTMKDLDALKKRLPPGIDIRITSKKVVKFRARFRKNGYPAVFKTTSDLQSAKQWLAEQERSALIGELHPTAMMGNKYTFSDAVNRYKEEELPKKGNDAKNRLYHLISFEKHLGKLKFSSIRSSDIKDTLLNIEKEKAKKGNIQALRIILDRILPVRKELPITLDLPEIKCAHDVLMAIAMITRAIAEGHISVSEGEALSKIIDINLKTLELHDFQIRLEKLESKRGSL